MLGHEAVVAEFKVSNEATQFENVTNNGRSKTPAELAYLNRLRNTETLIVDPTRRSADARDGSSIRWLTQKDLKKYQKIEEENLVQFSGVWIKASPNSVYSMTIKFAEEIGVTAEEGKLKSLYNSKFVFDVAPESYAIGGMISSPNYPLPYSSNTDTSWRVHIPLRHLYSLTLTVIELDTEACCDKIFVYNGVDDTSKILGIFSGQLQDVENPVIRTYSPDLYIRFVSDCSTNIGTFSLQYDTSIADEVKACSVDTRLPNTAGTFTSTGYPSDYSENSNCAWTIITTEGMYVTLWVVDFDFDENDSVIVYSIDANNNAKQIATLSSKDIGSGIPTNTTNRMMVQMNTNAHDAPHRGFSFKYNSTKIPKPCEEGIAIYGESSGVISSPNYPGDYGDNQQCRWQINVTPGSGIYMSITDFEMEPYWDHLMIYEGVDDVTGTEIASLSGYQDAGSAIYIANSDQVFIEFDSDISNSNYRGFQMELQEYVKSADCSHAVELEGTQGYVTTPNYPDPYPSDSKCQYLIEVPTGYIVQMVIPDISINLSDLLVIYNGGTTSAPVLFSSNHLPQINEIFLKSAGNAVLVSFESGSNSAYRGFSLRFNEYDVSGEYASTVNLQLPQGQIASPSFPHPYPTGIVASWSITTRVGTQVSLILKDFKISNGDTLTIYDGSSTTDDVLSTCTGSTCPSVQSSTRSFMLLVFDGKTSNDGFSFDYVTLSDSCSEASQAVSLNEGFLTSQRFPYTYPGIPCSYNISVPAGGPFSPTPTIRFDIQLLQTESCCDYLNIYDGSTQDPSQLIYSKSGSHQNDVVYTTQPSALVIWDVDLTVGSTGFDLHWVGEVPKVPYEGSGFESFDCAMYDTIESEIGQIASPAYPSYYPNNADTCWYFTYPVRYVGISFYMPRFHTEEGFDVLRFYRGASTQGFNLVEELSGDYIDIEVILAARQATVQFHSDDSVVGSGFVLHYVARL